MHGLDHYIEDIVPRLSDILDNAYNSPVASLQTSLAAYGWILLDSWITWRTTRFLLRNAIIDTTKEKWIQTPSSYSGNQLIAAWNFSETTRDYLGTVTGKDTVKNLVDKTIQAKRNSVAHMNGKEVVQGTDITEIKTIFSAFSTVFLAYEVNSFIDSIKMYFWKNGYHNFNVYLDGKQTNSITESLVQYSKSKELLISCSDSNSCLYELVIDNAGCLARKKISDDSKYLTVSNSVISNYDFFKNKGYYQNVDLFCKTVIGCWTIDAQLL